MEPDGRNRTTIYALQVHYSAIELIRLANRERVGRSSTDLESVCLPRLRSLVADVGIGPTMFCL